MKKKIISFIAAIMVLVPCLFINVFAQNNDIIILNGGQNLQYRGNTYMRFDASAVYFDSEEYLENIKYDTIEIKSADYEISKNAVMITAYFNYRDGSTLTAYFIDQRYYDEFLSTSENNNYSIDFHYPDEVVVPATKDELFGPKTTISENELLFCDEYDVTVQDPDQIYSIETGRLLICDNDYYYVDYKEADIYDPLEFYPSEMQSLDVHKITNPELCEQIKSAYGNGGTFDLFSSDFFGGISTAFVIIIFFIIPLAVLILFIILYNRAKSNTYKKILLSIWIAAAIELLVFVVTALLLLAFK